MSNTPKVINRFGEAGGYTVAIIRRPAKPNDPTHGQTVLTVALTGQGDPVEVAVLEEHDMATAYSGARMALGALQALAKRA